MKICIISLNIVPYYQKDRSSQFGGAEVQTAVLAEAFSEAGAEVQMVIADFDPATSIPFETHNAFRKDSGLPGLRFIHPRMTGILGALRASDADVYFQRCAGMITGVTSWFCKRKGKVFVYGAGSDTDFSPHDVMITGLRDRWLYFYGVRNAAGIVVQNSSQKKTCSGQLGRKARLIPNAVPLGPGDAGSKDGTVVWVGHLSRVKEPDVFLELARRLPERRFVLVGGPIASQRDFGEDVAARARELRNVSVTGRIPPAEAVGYIERAALLVNTSRLEGFPNAFLEAWVSRTPVVSFVDPDGLVGSEDIGVVCEAIDELVMTIDRLLDDDTLRSEMGIRARRLVEKRHDPQVLGRSYMEYFDTLLRN